jgi:hypothetical protein
MSSFLYRIAGIPNCAVTVSAFSLRQVQISKYGELTEDDELGSEIDEEDLDHSDLEKGKLPSLCRQSTVAVFSGATLEKYK